MLTVDALKKNIKNKNTSPIYLIWGTELYLADSEARKKGLWQRVHKAMLNLKIPPAIIDHIIQKQDVQILAKNLNDWQKIKKRR